MSNRMDTVVVAKSKGLIKGLKARRDGLTGVFRTLAEEHTEVATLIERLEADSNKRASLWPTIRIQLLSHERGELREVYPVLREHTETTQLADHHEAEAMELEDLIDELDAEDMESDDWGALFDQLAGTVLDHADEEETMIFPVAQRVIGEVRAKEIDAKFRATKKQIADAV